MISHYIFYSSLKLKKVKVKTKNKINRKIEKPIYSKGYVLSIKSIYSKNII